jgi:CheY-like chemotaxis protein
MSAAASVLVIEDELPIRRFLKPAIESAGHRLIEADTGQAGLLRASESPPDVIILDLGLPDIDGLDLIGRLREWYRGPIVILSARGQESDKVQALGSTPARTTSSRSPSASASCWLASAWRCGTPQRPPRPARRRRASTSATFASTWCGAKSAARGRSFTSRRWNTSCWRCS